MVTINEIEIIGLCMSDLPNMIHHLHKYVRDVDHLRTLQQLLALRVHVSVFYILAVYRNSHIGTVKAQVHTTTPKPPTLNPK